MQTVTDNLRDMAKGIQSLLEDLLLHHSSIHFWKTMVSGRYYAYTPLNEAGRQLQTRALGEYRHFFALMTVLLRGQPSPSLTRLSAADTLLTRIIEQQMTQHETTQKALQAATKSIEAQLSLLQHLYQPSGGHPVYVPDTNALLYNPTLEKWRFEEAPHFTLVLVPSVLSELDVLKINHRNEGVRRKAETLIRQIKEYGRRGVLTEGVTVLQGKIDVVGVAKEPNAEATLPWLDMQNNDDRFLAAVIEVMRNRPRSPVTIVTRDINLQNKAEFARLPFVEPPEPGRS